MTEMGRVAEKMPISIRPATAADHPSFVRLFPELGVDDKVPSSARFEGEMRAPTLIAEADGNVVGYAYFQLLAGVTYVRHLVADPAFRQRGVGRALMEAIRERGKCAGAHSWCLNVKPENAAAIALYERCGLREKSRSWPMRANWSCFDGVVPAATCTIRPGDDDRVTRERDLVPGLLADARAKGRVLAMIEDGGTITAAAAFDPDFPGAYPFRCARPDLAVPFAAALRAFARPHHDFILLMIENQPDVRDALLALGATVRVNIMHMAGPVDQY